MITFILFVFCTLWGMVLVLDENVSVKFTIMIFAFALIMLQVLILQVIVKNHQELMNGGN